MLAMHMQQYNSCFVNHFSVLSSRAPTMCQNCQNETAGDNQTSYFLLCRGDSVKCGCGRRMADGGRRTDKKIIIIEKNDMKNNKLIIEIVGQLMPFK